MGKFFIQIFIYQLEVLLLVREYVNHGCELFILTAKVDIKKHSTKFIFFLDLI